MVCQILYKYIFIEVPVLSQICVQSCVCVLGVYNFPVSLIFCWILKLPTVVFSLLRFIDSAVPQSMIHYNTFVRYKDFSFIVEFKDLFFVYVLF